MSRMRGWPLLAAVLEPQVEFGALGSSVLDVDDYPDSWEAI